MSSVIKSRPGRDPQERFNTADKEAMKQYGFIYEDGTYSDERELRGAYLVPRRPSGQHYWDPDSREWFLDGDAMPPATGNVTEPVAGETGTKAPTLQEVVDANPDLEKTIGVATIQLPHNNS